MASCESSLKPSTITRLGCLFAIVSLLGLSFSSSVVSIGLIIAAIASLIAERPQHIIACCRANPFLIWLLFLGIMLFIGVWNNDYNRHAAWHEFFKYVGKWLLFLCIMPLFIYQQCRTWLYHGIIIIALVTSIIIFLSINHLIPSLPISYLYAHIINAIPWSYFLAFSGFLLASQMIENQPGRWWKILVLLWLVWNLYFVNIERSGMLAGLLLAIIIAYQHLSWRKFLLAVSIILLAAVGLYFISTAVHDRVQQFILDIQQYYNGSHSSGSINLRLAFAKGSWQLIQHKSWLGYGTGSFPYAYHTTGGPVLPNTKLLGDPHNTFLHLWVQVGAIGLVFYILFLMSQWFAAYKCPRFERHLAQGLVISFIFMCLCVSAFLRQRLVVFYLMVFVACFASRINILMLVLPNKNKKQASANNQTTQLSPSPDTYPFGK